MNAVTEEAKTQVAWFVGANWSGDDQTQRFLDEGVWENGYEDKYTDVVNTMRPGERIAIKSAYTRKYDLPFDGRGHSVSAMKIKAIGTIKENLNDGCNIKVEWTKIEPREWYFYTSRVTVWRVLPGEWMADSLIAFAFEDNPQDVNRFRNAPYWQERFGTSLSDRKSFAWTKFYQAIADKLLTFRNNRQALIEHLHEISKHVEGLAYFSGDRYSDGTTGFIRDICPFTTLGIFNRGIKLDNRKAIAAELAKFLGVTEPVPDSFDGVPLMNNQKSWYFPYENQRDPDHIDALWAVFAAGIKFADAGDDDEEAAKWEFIKAYDNANGRYGVGWNLTFGLYWTRPWSFLSLDQGSRIYIKHKLEIPIGMRGPNHRCTAREYIAVMEALESHFLEDDYPVRSYPALSLEAWQYKASTSEGEDGDGDGDDETDIDINTDIEEVNPPPNAPYSITDILTDGCFLERPELEKLLERLRTKKNLILQGPPGTGKTWLAKRLAFALIGAKDDSKVRAVQFHPNLSYEDFVRGWRPSGDGKLSLVDGVFIGIIKAALQNPESKFVVVIEEINRGNPAQIFGELLTLLEASKRTPGEALELCYPDSDGIHRPVHIPDNLYVIGTMNIADRSLALVDLALRRRFAFVTLEPRLGEAWRNWVVRQGNLDSVLVTDIERRMTELNEQIATDARLGKPFRIGHSYVTPAQRLETDQTQSWFQQVVETEIGPLLEEYWFDAPDEARKARDRLLQGW